MRPDAVVESDEIQTSVCLPNKVDGLEVVERSILTGARCDTGDGPHHRLRKEPVVQHRRAGEIEVEPERQSVERGEHRREIVSVGKSSQGRGGRFPARPRDLDGQPPGRLRFRDVVEQHLGDARRSPVHRHRQDRSQRAESARVPDDVIKLDPRHHLAVAAGRFVPETDDEEIRPVLVGARDCQVAGLVGQPLNALKMVPQTKREVGQRGAVLRSWDQPSVTRRDMCAAGFDARKRRFHIVQNRGIGRARLLRPRVPRRRSEHHHQHRRLELVSLRAAVSRPAASVECEHL